MQIDIYDDGEGGWLLEIVDGFDNSTVWHDSFDTDQQALDAALLAIEEDGIDSMIGGIGGMGDAPLLPDGLTANELDELESLLTECSVQDLAMNVAALEGFLAAIAVGPRMVMPSEWLPWVWDMKDGGVAPNFDDMATASRLTELLLRYYNAVLQAFATEPPSFEPIIFYRPQLDIADWCMGFLLARQFDDAAWLDVLAHPAEPLLPMLMLASDDDLTDDELEECVTAIVPSLMFLHSHRRGERHSRQPQVRATPKVGRNDPCPCGSGKKFKKCCAVKAGAALH